MSFTVRCGRCTGVDLVCKELSADIRCPKCESVPMVYEAGGDRFCWIHREKMVHRYAVHPNFLLVEYWWRWGPSESFPNARLFDGGTEENAFSMSLYCTQCQAVYEEWFRGLRERQQEG